MKDIIEKIKVYFKSKKELEMQNGELIGKVKDFDKRYAQQMSEETDLYLKINDLKRQLGARPDPKNLMREDMGGLKLDINVKGNYLEGLSVEEIRQLNRWGFDLANNRWWKHMTDWCLNTEAVKAISNIPIDDRRALFGAGVLDGIISLKEMVESRKGAFEGDNVRPDGYDADRAIPD